jgi:uncharacterized protein
MIPEDAGALLVKLARASVESAFDESRPSVPGKSEVRGVFVTLTLDGELRGCIGFTDPVKPLYEAVIEAARLAAFEDPRFDPVSRKELQGLHVEVSVLTVPQLLHISEPKDALRKIRIGKDGLLIKSGIMSGLLLPQVAVEQGWDVEKFLGHTCMKAGLARDAWMRHGTLIYCFQTQIFKEG